MHIHLSLRKMLHANKAISNWEGFCDRNTSFGVVFCARWKPRSNFLRHNFAASHRGVIPNLFARRNNRDSSQSESINLRVSASHRVLDSSFAIRRRKYFFPLQEFSIIKGLILLLVLLSSKISPNISLPFLFALWNEPHFASHLSLSINISYV